MKILAVDDQEEILEEIGDCIKRRGHIFVPIVNPLEALELLKKESFDLILLDFKMKIFENGDWIEYTGDRLLEEVRTNPNILEFNKNIYVILITAYPKKAPPEKMLSDLDIQMYINKEIEPHQIAIMVESGVKHVIEGRKIQAYQQGLQGILEAVPNIYQTTFHVVLDNILNEITRIFVSEDTFLLIDDFKKVFPEYNKEYEFKGLGRYKYGIDSVQHEIGQYFYEVKDSCKTKKLDTGIIMPVTIENNCVVGYLYVYLQNGVTIEVDQLLHNYDTIVSVAIGNSMLHSKLDIKNDELDKNNKKLSDWFLEMTEALKETINAKDAYTCGHSKRVANMADLIGRKYGLLEKELENLRLAGILHDIGKISIRDMVLQKPAKLTNEEYDEIKEHPIKGAEIISTMSAYRENVAPLVRHHHEYYDGSKRGYPDNLKGEAIPLGARILAVADTIDAITSDRLHDKKRPLSEAKSQLILNSGTQFDPKIVDIAVSLIDEGIIKVDE